MISFFRAIASLTLTVVLLVMIAIVLSVGTIFESLRGAEAARAVYYAPWFFALQAAFAINVIAALWERFPRNRWRIGFLITHASMLLIFAGALLTYTRAVEGDLPLWEGERASSFRRAAKDGHTHAEALPFTVRLDAFEIDKYPGTERPAMFRSRITVIEKSGEERRAVIEMNRPFQHSGWRLFQSSYNLAEGREMSIFSVSKDPGQDLVFYGYYLLVLGMIVVLITRIAQFRMIEQARRGGAARAHAMLLVLGALALLGAPRAARAGELPPPGAIETLRRLPVQSDGREMPFDTQAREAVLAVTGQRQWQGVDPVAMVMGWVIHPRSWLDEPIVKVDSRVAALASLPEGTKYGSYRALASSQRLLNAMTAALERRDHGQRPAPGDKALLKFDERIQPLHAFLNGVAIRAIPGRERVDLWEAPPFATQLETWTQIEAQARRSPPAFYPTKAAIERELLYHRARPTFLAWLLLLPAAIAAGMTLERDRWKLRWVATIGTVLGFAVMTWGIAMRWMIAERIPASNMYESMLFLGWGVGLFGVVSLLFRGRMLVFNAAAMAALTMILLDRLPMDPFIRPMAPVLAGTPWLAIHVPIIMVSYSTFAIATFLGHLVLGARLFGRGGDATAEKWSQLLYWYLMVGSILLIAGILTGSIWAASSWGRYWGWDPKEVWSLVAFLAYMAILHARSDGKLSAFGVAAWSIAAFQTILMTYLGVNFVLASGLHSYGFGNSNMVLGMAVVAIAEIAFIAAAWQAGPQGRRAMAR